MDNGSSLCCAENTDIEICFIIVLLLIAQDNDNVLYRAQVIEVSRLRKKNIL